jgi:hypothetical protein
MSESQIPDRLYPVSKIIFDGTRGSLQEAHRSLREPLNGTMLAKATGDPDVDQ